MAYAMPATAAPPMINGSRIPMLPPTSPPVSAVPTCDAAPAPCPGTLAPFAAPEEPLSPEEPLLPPEPEPPVPGPPPEPGGDVAAASWAAATPAGPKLWSSLVVAEEIGCPEGWCERSTV